MTAFFKTHLLSIGLLLLCSLCYLSFGYGLAREESLQLIGLTVAAFFLTHRLLVVERKNFRLLLFTGILYRLVLFWSIPELSQDFYRYIWDGSLYINGINPYLHKPVDLITQLTNSIPNARFLYDKMGELSQNHYSNYPPISQYVYALAAYLGQGSIQVSIWIFKSLILGADLAILFLCRWLMQQLGLPTWKAFWYFLNPLVIMELSGNLHLEGLMIAFFLAGICAVVYTYKKSQDGWPLEGKQQLDNTRQLNDTGKFYGPEWQPQLLIAVCMSLSIMTKLIPILFYPFLIFALGFKRWFTTGLVILGCSALLLWPLLGQGFFGYYLETIGLWFHNFEFNASLYNLIKSISKAAGYSGYRTIITYGKVLPFLMITLAMGLLAWQYRQGLKIQNTRMNTVRLVLCSMLFMYTGHLLIATTVHPWYLIFGLILSLFTPYRFFVVWSLSVILSYVTYAIPDFKENLWILAIEYLFLFGALLYEIVTIKMSDYYSVKNV